MGKEDEIRVGIDGRSLRSGPAGMATYVGNLLEHVPFLDRFDPHFPNNNFLWNHSQVLLAQLRRGWSVYHAPSYTCPLVNFCPLVLSVADISYFVREEWYPYRLDRVRRRYYLASLKRADRILVPTDFSRNEILQRFPELQPRLRRVYLGVSESFSHDDYLANQVRAELDLPSEYILHVGDIHPRRNLEALAGAAEHLGLDLVLVGKILRGGEGFANWPHLYSGLSQPQLRGVYSAASVFAYPSIYEGFGLPMLEAMACGVPVVASNRSCLPEVCGDAAALVDPDAESFAKAIQEVRSDRRSYIARGLSRARLFSWKETAKATVRVYRELI